MTFFEWVAAVVLFVFGVAVFAVGVFGPRIVKRATHQGMSERAAEAIADFVLLDAEMRGARPVAGWLPATTPDEEAVRAHLREDWLHFADDYQSVLGEAWTDSTGGQR